jgi:peptidyl-prolyl cis-trans isomerase A (cyclophilin A)
MRLLMKPIILLAALAATAAVPALAQPAPAAPAAGTPAPADDLVTVALDTAKGRIVIALDRGRAPLTTANFLKYVDGKKLDGEVFYRAMKMDGSGLIQGGIQSDARKQLPPVAHEPTTKTGIKHLAGTISMANAGAGTARSDFFIMLGDTPGFDADGPGSDGTGFAAFGRVVEGMDVVKAIFEAPTSPTRGVGIMKGQMLEPPVEILKASRVR